MDPVPTLFRWPYGGKLVYIAGSFNDWKGKVPMRREGPTDNPQFTISLDLRPGTYYYKFIVDDQWQHDPVRRYERHELRLHHNADLVQLSQ